MFHDKYGTELQLGDCYFYESWVPQEYRLITKLLSNELLLLKLPSQESSSVSAEYLASEAVRIEACDRCPNLFGCLNTGFVKDAA